ncbi:DUF983 domain-containing protein [Catalinimonas niigatensis]|uniref:DUF983 domain-containing protein n=1 Tax=Catalinimonas niigatensis TaxID=1397264 RepID=UPI0026650DF4|nr:DUF983 domain-containing protein [Catalinimonas niigatensis]WPP51503.1 DUF983 domain-containing protein [Catalinimonas niigatensis]
MQKKSALSAIINHKCPRCRQGDLFKYSLLEKPHRFTETNKTCPHCQLIFEREPGFFFGAMYVSYALTMGVLLSTAFILYNLFGDPELWVYILTVPSIVLLLLPVIFRYSRTLYLHGFGGVSFDKKYTEEVEL